jgi:hypothetical protein
MIMSPSRGQPFPLTHLLASMVDNVGVFIAILSRHKSSSRALREEAAPRHDVAQHTMQQMQARAATMGKLKP